MRDKQVKSYPEIPKAILFTESIYHPKNPSTTQGL